MRGFIRFDFVDCIANNHKIFKVVSKGSALGCCPLVSTMTVSMSKGYDMININIRGFDKGFTRINSKPQTIFDRTVRSGSG